MSLAKNGKLRLAVHIGVELHHDADAAAAMDIGGDHAFVTDKTADLQIFTDHENLIPQRVGNRHVAALQLGLAQCLHIGGILCGRRFCHSVHKGLEVGVFGDEVSLGVDLDNNTHAVFRHRVHHAFRSDSAGLFRRGRKAFFTQELPCFFHISIRFGEGLFAVHHAATGSFSQCLYIFCCKCWHR